ncbi:MAG: morA [Acidimicrobiales bacterium]|nr:morA [Acidimicrobiales bacterium]
MHLAAIAVAVVVVYLVLGTIAGVRTLRSGERDARADARYLAEVAAKAVSGSLTLGQSHVASLAANPKASAVFAAPAGCELSFDLALFPRSRLDVVATDGRVACSSAAFESVAPTHAGASWLAGLTTDRSPFETGMFLDRRTGDPAVGFGVPVADGSGGVLGAVVLVIPTEGIAAQLAEGFAGPRGYMFALVDSTSGSVASVSSPSLLDGAVVRVDGFLSGSKVVPGTPWRVIAAVRSSSALAPVWSMLRWGLLVGAAMLVVLLAGMALVGRRIAWPLRQLNDAVGHEGPGAINALATLRGPFEVERLAAEFHAALVAHADYEAQLSHQALHDPLTGLPNRALLTDRLVQALRQAERTGHQVCVLFVDIDHFKLINDGLGHAVGDLVLTTTAERLTSVLRAGDTLARFGGDEFVFIGEALDDGDAERLAGRLLDAVQAPIEIDDTVVRVTASAGIALGRSSADGAVLLRDADAAMYLAKDRGRSRHEVFNEDLRDRARTRLTIETEFRVALERGELHVAYQPKVDLVTREAVGVEALLRWDHPALGSVSPATFIPIAEDTGLIVPVGQFVLDQACQQAGRWRREGIEVDVAVNVSGHQLTDPTLLEHVARALATNGLEPERLCLELTESVLMRDTARTASVLDAVHRLGVQISIDDFGTGYSSLAYLHRFPVDELKIDRSFVHNLAEEPHQQSLVTAMIAMGKALGLRIVAEGVEGQREAELLQVMGCDQAQGYLFARPQPADALGHALRRTTTAPAS